METETKRTWDTTADELKGNEAEVIEHWLLQVSEVRATGEVVEVFGGGLGFRPAILSDREVLAVAA